MSAKKAKPSGSRTAIEDPQPLVQLRTRVEQAAKLIGQLRETNYALTAELARLKNERVEQATLAPEVSSPEPTDSSSHSNASPDSNDSNQSNGATQAQIDLLLDERRLVREKVRSILGRLESLETPAPGDAGQN